jgi:TPR repeat protein
MLHSMEKSWFHKMFSPAQKSELAAAPSELDYTDAEVQFNLGLQFANGSEPKPDYAQAAGWYRKAAEQDHVLAQFNLGMMYLRGQGVARDEAQSAVWFGRAANLGDAGSQYILGVRCQRESMDCLPAMQSKARIEAYKWYQLAAGQGYKKSEIDCVTLTYKMTSEDVAEANHRVAQFVASRTNSHNPASTPSGPDENSTKPGCVITDLTAHFGPPTT